MYCSLQEVKQELKITGDEDEGVLESMIRRTKEFIDNELNRHFDVRSEARLFDGAGKILFIDDLISIDGEDGSFELDFDGDGTYEKELEPTDYLLYPLNKTPKILVKLGNQSKVGSFADSVKAGVKITGTWGYASEIPEVIRGACIMQVCRWFERRKTNYATKITGSPELGELEIYQGLDPDIKLMIQPFRRVKI